ncbi:hypothetical protein NEF87_001915 [Candidatus Lokiarchaeum ossiferum]|uniref:DinB-like domain-containing protein n=1 Tax=Candidatus Lokiarchaeum ossiferum TaxID=2951803 RepID=A0ABY6HQ34_9ARCH|nr:hypothetical protein NEF87_001915 [Candidatus Lokiarchaeum sp. B-35]
MQKQFLEDMIQAMSGVCTHISPDDALVNLSPQESKIKPENKLHSCWDLLHHLIAWQNIIIQNLEGKFRDWSNIPVEENWPTEEDLSDEQNFIKLKNKLKTNVEKIKQLLDTMDLMEFVKIISGEKKKPVTKFRLILVFLQHTSYHIGQIITTRKLLGIWDED